MGRPIVHKYGNSMKDFHTQRASMRSKSVGMGDMDFHQEGSARGRKRKLQPALYRLFPRHFSADDGKPRLERRRR